MSKSKTKPSLDPAERMPHCQRCAQHNVRNRLRGHKANCPFKDCPCAKCLVVIERQKLMADQIKLRRLQKKQKSLQQKNRVTQQVTQESSKERSESSMQNPLLPPNPTLNPFLLMSLFGLNPFFPLEISSV